MSVISRRASGTAILCAFAAQGAYAEVTAKGVWEDWQAYLGGMGYEVSGTESATSGGLTISDLTMRMVLPEDQGDISLSMPELTLTENGDGTVSVEWPDSFPYSLSITPEDDVAVSAEVTVTSRDAGMVVSGATDDMTYDYGADGFAIELTSLDVQGEDIPDGALKLLVDMGRVAGKSRMQVGEHRTISQSMTADTLTYDIAFDDPDGGGNVKMKGGMTGLVFDGTGTVPKEFDAANYQSMMDAGFEFSGGFTYAAGNSDVQTVGTGEDFSLQSSSQGGDFRIGMDASRLLYDIAQRGVQIAMSGQEIPFPIELAMAAAGLKIEVPIQKDDAPQPFGLAVNLTDFTMSDMIWSMFDPAGALPRDPATVRLDADGTATVAVNFLDPAVAETLDATGAAPGELNSLNVRELVVSLVGASLTGDGAFEFDNSDLVSYGGMPAPSGTANLQLVGANTLIDKLVAMGFVQESDAMGARMMMGMLAIPGSEPDTLNSTIEFTRDGQILANGQRIK